MDNKSAVSLYNTLCATYYEQCSDTTKFGAVMQSHGLQTWLWNKESYEKSDSPNLISRRAAADFLRTWADSIEKAE